MRTDQLIADLAAEPTATADAAGRIALAMLLGGAAGLGLLWILFGSPLGPVADRGMTASAIKFSYPAAVALFAAAAAIQSGRPGASVGVRLALLLIPFVAIALLALSVLQPVPSAGWDDRLFGTTLVKCVLSVAFASLPVFAGLTWTFRLLAPTRLHMAGFLIGLASGGAGAAAYALYCPELSPAFLAGSYTPAMLVPALAGALGGRTLLRW